MPSSLLSLNSWFLLKIKKLLDNVASNLKIKENECQVWKVKYNIQTQQERELAKQQEEVAAKTEKLLSVAE